MSSTFTVGETADGKFFVEGLHPELNRLEFPTRAGAEEEIENLAFANIRPGESMQEREDRLIGNARPLVNVPCDCEEDTGFRCYPEDGACECGCWKHHVHNQCGHIVQWG